MKILVCNAGSTSLKFKVYAFPEETVLARGRVERVGAEAGSLYFFESADGRRVTDDKARARTYEAGIASFAISAARRTWTRWRIRPCSRRASRACT